MGVMVGLFLGIVIRTAEIDRQRRAIGRMYLERRVAACEIDIEDIV